MTIHNGFVFANKERQLPKPTWWIEDFMIEKSVAMLSSQPKEGKSCFAAVLTKACATGDEFFGRKVPEGTVLYLAGERANQTEDRILELFAETGEVPVNYVIFVPTMSDLGPIKFNRDLVTADVDKLIQEVRQYNMNPDLIIVDTLSQFFEGKQNDEQAMHAFFVGVRKLADAFSACALVLHHDTKLYVDRSGQVSGGGAPRGSGDAFASVDTLIRARTVKQLSDPDDTKREIRIVQFQLEADNFGGYFEETVAVRKLFEDPTKYLEAEDSRRDDQKRLMFDVLESQGPLTDTQWKTAVREKLTEKSTLGKLGNKKFEEMRDQLVREGLVRWYPNPNRANGKLYEVVKASPPKSSPLRNN